MKVKELIAILQDVDPEMDVVVEQYHVESGNSLRKPYKTQVVDVETVNRDCRDMMDGERYTTSLLMHTLWGRHGGYPAGKRFLIS